MFILCSCKHHTKLIATITGKHILNKEHNIHQALKRVTKRFTVPHLDLYSCPYLTKDFASFLRGGGGSNKLND